MTIISKLAGGLSLVSCLTDAHKTGLIYANNEFAKVSGDVFIANSLGSQKAEKVSEKDAQRKNWLFRNNFFGGIRENIARVRGYLGGFGTSIVRYMPNFVLSAVALFTKSSVFSGFSTIGLAAIELYDFIRNSTSIFQRTDYLE